MRQNHRLRHERERRGWSQARVAEQIGTYPQSVGRWERGVAQPYPHFREKLCALFGKDAEALGLIATEEDDDEQHESHQPNTQKTSRWQLKTVDQPGDKKRDTERQLTDKNEKHRLPRTTAAVVPADPCREPQEQTAILDPAVPLLQVEAGELSGRQELLRQLKHHLSGKETWSTPAAWKWLVLQGLPGVGKSALAVSLAHDPEVQATFGDGVLWANMGVDLLEHLRRWAVLLGHDPEAAQQSQGYEKLATFIQARARTRRILFVLDDAWDINTVLALRLGGNKCAYLVTTRAPLVAHHFAAQEVWHIEELHERYSLQILTHFVPRLVASETPLLKNLLRRAGGLPLALIVMGRYLRTQGADGQPRRLAAALQELGSDEGQLRVSGPRALIDYQHLSTPGDVISLSVSFTVSMARLTERERQALCSLTLFPPKPNSFSEEAGLVICEVPVTVLDRLSDIGLLESSEPGRYQLHPAIASYAKAQGKYDEEAVQRFIDHMLTFVEEKREDYNALEQEVQNILAALEQAWHLEMHLPYIRGILALTNFLEVRAAYETAETHLSQAYQAARSINAVPYIIIALYHLGLIARAQNLLLKAETYLREGLLYARKLADRKMENHFLITITEVLEQRGEYAQAHMHLHKAVKLARYLKDNERADYHRVPINYSQDSMCVHFTEPQSMLQRGYLADIDPLFRNWRYANAISPQARQIVTGGNGHIYGVPVDAYQLCLVYNRRIFREAGLDPDMPPKTWEEFRTVARLVARPLKGLYGFAAETIYGQGGWHLTNWLYTAGIQGQEYRHGRWQTTFNAPQAVEFLDMLHAMRFQDHSVPRQTLLYASDTRDMFSAGQLAMIISTPHIINELYRYKETGIDIDDIGLAPMPQNGGNACLMGGVAYVFDVSSSERAIKTAFEQIVTAHFALDDYERYVRESRALGEAIGVPNFALFTSEVQQQRKEIEARYANVPLENYQLFMQSTLVPQTEPPIEAQKYYALLDPIMQAVLTNREARPRALLDAAARQFQEQVLSQYSQEKMHA